MTRHTRSLPFFRRERESLLLDILCGAAVGAYHLLRRAFA